MRASFPGYQLLVLCVLISTAVGLSGLYHPTSGAWQDVDVASGNTIQTGSFDAKLSEVGPASQLSTTDETDVDVVADTWEDHAHVNGSAETVNNTLELANPYTRATVVAVNITVTYGQNDTDTDDAVDDSEATARSITVSSFAYNGTELVGADLTDKNGNGQVDLDDAAKTDLTGLEGIGAGTSATLTIELYGDASESDAIVGGDGIDFTLTIVCGVSPSWRDIDRSLNNTLQYS